MSPEEILELKKEPYDIVLITGASGGIGSAAVRYFLERGHRVTGLDLMPAVIEHERYTHMICDITKAEDLPAFAREEMPQVLVNCAGVQESGRDIDVNLKGTIRITEKYAIENERIRSVVNIGSASAHTGSEFPEYAASKGGLMAYTKNTALRLAPRAICNSIDAGGVVTDLNRPVMEDPELWNRIMDLTPLKRWARPEEIAEWIYFVGVTNRFMTGQCILIDGGEAGNTTFVWKDQRG